jgi:hypothetical protein
VSPFLCRSIAISWEGRAQQRIHNIHFEVFLDGTAVLEAEAEIVCAVRMAPVELGARHKVL